MNTLGFDVWENVTRCMQQVARQIWDEQVAAVHVRQPYSEETITERVAVLLKQAIVAEGGVHVRTFNKHEEGNKETGTGADLAIWVQLRSGTYGFHFQAKSRVIGGAFASLRPGGSQHLQLLKAADQERANPAFLFYPAPDVAAGAHHPTPDIRDFGCSAIAAYSFDGSFVPTSARFESLSAAWAPWHVFALATTLIGNGESPTFVHPAVAAPSALPIRASGLPDYLVDAKRGNHSYSDPDDTVIKQAPRPKRTLVIERGS